MLFSAFYHTKLYIYVDLRMIVLVPLEDNQNS